MSVASVRMLRREQGWTLEDLADRAGMTTSYLSKVERGHSTPSIAVAMNLARALRVDVFELFGASEDAGPVEVSRADEHDALGAAVPATGSTYLSLANRMTGKQMMPFLLHPPTTAARCTFREHDGDEFVIVLAGHVELRFPDRTEHLGPGDSAYFRAGLAHQFRSIGDDGAQAEVLAVIASDIATTPPPGQLPDRMGAQSAQRCRHKSSGNRKLRPTATPR